MQCSQDPDSQVVTHRQEDNHNGRGSTKEKRGQIPHCAPGLGVLPQEVRLEINYKGEKTLQNTKHMESKQHAAKEPAAHSPT